MKKILIFLACILCLTLLFVSCKPKGGDKTETDQNGAQATNPGDVNWGDLTGSGDGTPTQEFPTADGFEVGTDDPDGGWSPIIPPQ